MSALQAALEELPAEERAQVEALLQQATEQAITRARSRRPEEIVADLPAALRAAWEQQDEAAFQAALTALPEEDRRRALADLADLQTLNLLAAQEAQQRDPRERFASLLRDIARVASGDDESRDAIRAALAQLEQNGWQLRAPVERIWAGERDRDSLVEGLDEQDTALIERVLELIAAPEETTGIENEAPPLPPQRERGTGGEGHPPRPRPDIDQIIQHFLPLLGDIALAACGDAVARQLAEAVLPRLDEGGWQLEQAARRIWAGEQDGDVLTEGIDPNSAALVRRTLRLVADGPGMIFVAGSLQIANLRRQVDGATAQALASGDAQERATLAQRFAELAGQAEQQTGAPWQELAEHLRVLAAQLREA